jgi:uncharacterized repeat protein (TIGR01451 family)
MIFPPKYRQPSEKSWSRIVQAGQRSWLALLLGNSALLLTTIPATAQIVVPFSTPTRPFRYQTNTRGDIKFVSNTVATCSTLNVSSTATKLTTSSFSSGDIVNYTVTVKNSATVAVDNLILQSTIPTGMTYVPGSLKINSSLPTDATDPDSAEVTNGKINFRVGTGASSTSGGSLAVSATATINFSLQIDASASGDIVVPTNVSYTEGGTSVTPVGNILASTKITIGSNISTNSGNLGSICALARAGGNRNNTFPLVYVDVDSDSTTFNSSRSDLSLPADAVVLFAGLYWGGSSTNANRGNVKFAGPNGSYTDLTADSLYSGINITTGTDDDLSYNNSYQGFKDVTATVKQGGSGQYRVGNIQTDSGISNRWGGWSLVVVYKNNTEQPRNLTVFDGYGVVSGAPVSIPINGFITPPFGPINAKIGAIVYDGDAGSTGDRASFKSNTGTEVFLTDSTNPSTDIFNSTISYLGTHVTTKAPNYKNQLGYDADIYSANNIINRGDTSATITLSTSLTNEIYIPGVITSSIDLYVPTVNLGKSFVDVNGGNLEPGDIIEYTMVVTNNKDTYGNGDPSENNVVTDPIPAYTTYVPGSLLINGVAKTDASGDDEADFDGTKTTFRIGTGATASLGGILSVNTGTPAIPSAPSTSTVKFRVKVNTNVPNKTPITNVAAAAYTGSTLGEGQSLDIASPGVTIETHKSSISGTLYKDGNLDSTYNNGERLMPAAIKVTLYKDLNNNNTIDSGEEVAVVDTDTNGKYTFLEVSDGTYKIKVDTTDPQIPTGKLLLTPNNLTATIAGLPIIDKNFGFTPNTPANLLLVKRITAINNSTVTSGGDDLAVYKDETSNPYDDNSLTIPALTPPDTDKWPMLNSSPFMVGGTNGGLIKTNDSIEYTIYFLSAGDNAAKGVLLCDLVPSNLAFIPTAYNLAGGGVDRGIAVKLGTNSIQSYTNDADSDFAQYFPAGVEPSTVYPGISCSKPDPLNPTIQLPNNNGAVVVNLGTIPGIETPNSSYGFFRFQGRMK